MVIVYGAGISGKGALELLKEKNIQAVLVDDKLEELKTEDAFKLLEEEQIDFIVKSPGIPFENSFITQAKNKGIQILSEIDLACMYLNKNIKIIAFTGTNGKTTTSIKMYELLKKANFKVALAGNVGNSFAKIVKENEDLEYIVLELSSYQLENMPKIKPFIAGIINLTPDHLSRYENEVHYYLTKFNIFSNQDENCYSIVNLDDVNFNNLKNDIAIKSKQITVSKNLKADVYIKEEAIYYLDSKIINVKDLSLKGEHNLENMLFVIASAIICNVEINIISNFLKVAKSVEHRMEEFFKYKESIFVNDSKGTNPDSTIKAINSYLGDICLICGGQDKKVPLNLLAKEVKKRVKFVYLFGENRYLLENEFKAIKFSDYIIFDNLEECIMDIKLSYKPYSYFLFSPATASFDQFENFEKRGKYFKETVLKILGDQNV